MRILLHVLFWLVNSFLIILFVGGKDAIYFSVVFTSFLLPVVVAVTYTFNYWLFPKYLFKNHLYKFILFGLFVVVLLIYLETLIVFWALIYLGNYSFLNMTAVSYNIEQLAVILFFIVFLGNLIYLIRRWSSKDTVVGTLIQFRVNRKVIQLCDSKINYFESLGDYVKIYAEDKMFTTREKISKLEDRLPDTFIRVHRSYIINTLKIESFNTTKIQIQGCDIPISRKYKTEVLKKIR